MKMNTLILRTECFFHRYDSIVRDAGDYTVIETPKNRSFQYGNCLIFPHAPRAGDYQKWMTLFEREFAHAPEIKHRLFVWDDNKGPDGESADFLKNGFAHDRAVTLATSKVHKAPHHNEHVVVRPIQGDAEWSEALETQILCREPIYSEENYRVFKTAQMLRYREMVSKGLGTWFGAFLEGKMAGNLGLFRIDELARFQTVSTHPAARRQGVCRALVHGVSELALSKWGVQTLVMCADDAETAKDIYQSVGFKIAERANALKRVG